MSSIILKGIASLSLNAIEKTCVQTISARTFYRYRDPKYKKYRYVRVRKKHYDPKWKKERSRKTIKIELPDFNENPEEFTPQKMREKMKERGIQPFRSWDEKPIYLSTLGDVIEPYVPPEGDGKISFTSKAGAKQKAQLITKKGKSYMTVRKIREYDEDFEPKDFAEEAQKIYIEHNEALAKFDEHRLHQLVTERAYPIVTHQVKFKQLIRWSFINSLEPPRVVYARHTDIITKDNIFAQITVRFHTKQTLAVYDRFGRLQHGSEVVARDVLEYVVFEKHLANEYGTWRIHHKIIPDWMPKRPSILRTFKMKNEPEEEAASESAVAVTSESNNKPAIATA